MHRRIVLLGPPAAGKGTQAEMLRREFGFETPSVGAMLRQQKSAGTAAGLEAAAYFDRGLLVPDAITIEVVRQWLGRRDHPDSENRAWILDGFPRTVAQGAAFEAMLGSEGLGIDAAILLTLEEPAIRDRVRRRLVCATCGAIFSALLHATGDGDPCSRCDGALSRRLDDNQETVTLRLAEYLERTEPLIPLYRARGLLHEFDGNRPVDQIFSEVARALGCAASASFFL